MKTELTYLPMGKFFILSGWGWTHHGWLGLDIGVKVVWIIL
jgi:hypothetical protein